MENVQMYKKIIFILGFRKGWEFINQLILIVVFCKSSELRFLFLQSSSAHIGLKQVMRHVVLMHECFIVTEHIVHVSGYFCRIAMIWYEHDFIQIQYVNIYFDYLIK